MEEAVSAAETQHKQLEMLLEAELDGSSSGITTAAGACDGIGGGGGVGAVRQRRRARQQAAGTAAKSVEAPAGAAPPPLPLLSSGAATLAVPSASSLAALEQELAVELEKVRQMIHHGGTHS